MSVDKLIVRLRRLGIELKVNDGQLEINAPKGAMTGEILSELKQNKEAILDFFSDSSAAPAEVHIPKAKEAPYYRLSNAQKRFYILTRLEDRSKAYNEFEAYTISGPVDTAIFSRAIQELLRRHEILRTNFITIEDEVWQTIEPSENIGEELIYSDLRGVECQAQKLEEIAAGMMDTTFDLAHDRLFKARLVQIADQQFVFLFTVHHIVVDGWSAKILFRELSELYLANLTGNDSYLSPLPIQYKDYAEWQVARYENGLYEASENYWLNLLQGELPVLELPAVKPRPGIKTFAGAVFNRNFDSVFGKSLSDFARQKGVSNYMTLVSLVKVLLYKYTSQREILIGTTVSGRENEQLENLLGCFLNTIVLRNTIDPEESFNELLSRIKDNLLDAFRYQNYPFDELLEKLDVRTELSRSALFDVLIELHNFEKIAEGMEQMQGETDLQIAPYIYDKTTSQLDLTFSFYQTSEEQFGVTVYYNTDLFDNTYVEDLIARFEMLAQQVFANAGRKIHRYQIMLPKDHDYLKEFHETTRVIPEGTFFDVFRQHVLHDGNATAIEYNGEELSYARLDERINRLSRYLLAKGLNNEEPVIVIMRRSPELLIAMLGVMRAGGVYIPLSTDYPVERIIQIVNDSQARCIIADTEVLSDNFLAGITHETTVKLVLQASEEDSTEVNERFATYRLLADLLQSDEEPEVATEYLRYANQTLDLTELANKVADLRPFLKGLEGRSAALCFQNPLYTIISLLALRKSGIGTIVIDPYDTRLTMREVIAENNSAAILTEAALFDVLDEVYWELGGRTDLLVIDTLEEEGSESTKESDFRDVWNYKAEITTEAINDYGWMNSYTNEAFSEAEMQEYIDNFCNKLAPYLHADARVLEIGCGHGLVLFNVAPSSGHYVATDISPVILQKNQQRIDREGLHHVENYALSAREIDQVDKPGYFDIVLCSSVVHYFPNTYYLQDVVRKAIELTADEGIVYLDDLIDLEKKAELVTSAVEFNRSLPKPTAKTDWDNDLFVPQRFFDYLQTVFPEIASVECSPKQGEIDNELTRYRYDALLRINKRSRKKDNSHSINSRRHLSIGLDKVKGYEAGADADLLPLKSVSRSFVESLNHVAQAPANEPDKRIEKGQLAYIIYTSGSTGKPKGAMVEHVGMLNHLCAKVNDLQMDADSIVVQNASQTFDISIWQFLSALMTGGKTLVYDQALVLSPEEFTDRIAKDKVTVLEVVPSYLSAMLEILEESGIRDFRTLRFLMVTGETLQSKLVERWFALYPEIKMVNAYGPTEASDDITHHIMEVPPADGVVPIGKTVQNFNIHILNEYLNQCPVGIRGELCVSGIGVGRGYLGDPERTAKSFITDPFAKKSGIRMYRTGDLARFLTNGTLEFFGRIDSQVKVRGHRIELGEIETRLTGLDGVAEAIVILKQDRKEQNYLSGYVTLVRDNAVPIEAEQIREQLKAVLPAYMVPDYLAILPEMPVTINGKVDRKALQKAPDGNQAAIIRKPRNEIESSLLDLWKLLLDADDLSIDANFFELGGHSLLATRLISRIQKFFSVKLELRDVFENPTIEKLSALLSKQTRTEQDKIAPAPALPRYPLSHGQKRLYILSKMGDSLAYNISGAYEIQGTFSKEALNFALNQLMVRHEILRTVFTTDPATDEPVQIIQSTVSFSLEAEITDLSGSPEVSRKTEQTIEAEAAYLFDLEKGPLLRCRVLRTAPQHHILVLTLHHIIADGWSMDLLIREFYTFYHSYLGGQPADLPSLSLQYRDFAYWQHSQSGNALMEEASAYWKETFSGEIPVLELPYKASRPALKTLNGGWAVCRLDRHTAEALKQIARDQNSSLFMSLLSTVNALLYIHSRQKDIVIGTPVAGRNDSELEQQVGLYINTLAIKSEVSGEMSFAGLLAQARQKLLAAYKYQHYPFDLLVEQLDLPRDLSRSPLFDVMVVFQNTSLKDEAGQHGYFEVTELAPEKTFSKFDLTFNFHEAGEEIVLRLDYNTDLFSANMIESLLARYVALSSELVQQETAAIDSLNFLPDDEREMLQALSSTNIDLPAEPNVLAGFNQIVQTSGDRPALFYNGKTFSYTELDAQSDHVAACLQLQYGVIKGDIVAIHLPRSAGFIISMLGILKAGAAYLPLAYDSPSDRMKVICEEAGVRHIISDNKAVVGFHSNIIHLSDAIAFNAIDGFKQPTLIQKDPVYVIFTSGSTGHPKGVLISHLSLLNYTGWFNTTYSITPEDRTVLLSSPAFDLCYTSLWTSLLAGAFIHILPEQEHMELSHLTEGILASEATFIKITPSHMNLLVSDPDYEQHIRQYKLRLVVSGGEAINPDHVNILLADRPDWRLVNHYGPTETTIGAIVHDIDLTSVKEFQSQPCIGKGIQNTRVYVLNESGYMVPPGVTGEICIGGLGLALGYLNRSDLTREKFVKDPYIPGAKIYRTGDLGYVNNKGQVCLLGRADDQVKVRGYRVEPLEIARLLEDIEGITGAHVLTHESSNGSEVELVAYYTADMEVETSSLYERLQKQLPAYMLPAGIVHVDSFPVTRNGKLDQKSLRAHFVGRQDQDIHKSASGPVESHILSLFREVLGKDQLGVTADFFRSGGHSLKAMILASRLRKQLSYDVQLKDIFLYPTVENLAAELSTRKKAAQETIPKAADKDLYILSNGQRRLWVLDRLEDAGAAYNTTSVTHLRGALDTNRLHAGFLALVEQHEILRTIFVEVDGQPYQQVQSVAESGFKVEQINLEQADKQEEVLKTLVRQASEYRFDLAKGPLLKVKLFRMHGQHHVLMILMHHIISDAWSASVMMNDIIQRYHESGITLADPLPIQYKDYAEWQHASLTSGVWEDSRNYWHKSLSGQLPLLDIPADFTRPAIKSFEGDVLTFGLEQNLWQQMQVFTASKGLNTFTLLFSLVNAWLYRYTTQNDIIIGVPVAGRDREELEGQIGFYLNMLPLRTRLSGKKSFDELLISTSRLIAEGLSHQHYPFDSLVEELDLSRDLSRSPVFDVLVSYENETSQLADDTSGLVIESAPGRVQVSKYDLSFYFIETANGLTVSIEYSTALFLPDRIRRVKDYFLTLSHHLLSNPAAPLAEFSYVPDDELDVLINRLNPLPVSFPRNKTVHQLLSEQSATYPEAIAIRHNGQSYSYKELEAKSDQIAAAIQNRGMASGTVIAVLMDRSAETLMVLLGIIKAGAAYLPIDPGLPVERIRYILQDSGALLVIADDAYSSLSQEVGIPFVTPNVLVAHDAAYQPVSHEQSADQLMYLIYTSGSTGQPKGVKIAHSSVVNLLTSMKDKLSIGTEERWLAHTTLSFDIHVLELFLPLYSGNTVVMADALEAKEPEALLSLLAAEKVTILQATPSLWHMLINFGWKGNDALKMISGGEALDKSLGLRLMQMGEELYNVYGPTETTVWSTVKQVKEEKDLESIGCPIANTSIYILNDELQPVGYGVPGQLYIGGAGLAIGYHDRPELTASRFVDSPFHPAEKIYHTGDIARWSPENDLVYLGRSDFQVKVRGHRIEPGEIEWQLQQHKLIQTAVLKAWQENEETILVAYYLSEKELDDQSLRDYLFSSLPGYMIPSRYVWLKELPLTPNGKVDRQKLSRPATEGLKPADTTNELLTETEEILTHIYASVLKRENIRVSDNFFDLGGHSLKAVQIISRIREVLKVAVSLRMIFTNPTIRRLTQAIENETVQQVVSIHPVEEQENYPVSNTQKQMWIGHQLQEDKSSFLITAAFKIKGHLDINALQKAYSQSVERHETLRTTFVMDRGEVRQKVHPMDDRFVNLVQGRWPGGDDYFGYARQDMEELFDLEAGPLHKMWVLNESEAHVRLIFIMNHIISDAWSQHLLLNEILQQYEHIISGSHAVRPALPVQYKDYVAWEQSRLASADLSAIKAFWSDRLGKPGSNLIPPPAFAGSAGRSETIKQEITVDEVNSTVLKELATAQGTTLFTVLYSCVKVAIASLFQQMNPVVAVPLSGRNQSELEEQIGNYVDLLPLRNRIQKEDTFTSLLKAEATDFTASLTHHYPFDLLTALLNIEGSTLFDAGFTWQNTEDMVVNAVQPTDTLDISTGDIYNQQAKANLWFHGYEVPEGLGMTILYKPDFLNEKGFTELIHRIKEVIGRVSHSPSTTIEDILYNLDQDHSMREKKDAKLKKGKNLDKFFNTKKKVVKIQQTGLVTLRPDFTEAGYPVLATPAVKALDLTGWVKENIQLIRDTLREKGAILFRGFDGVDPDTFRQVGDLIGTMPMGYNDPSSPRTKVSEKLYTSTDHPSDQVINLHSEMSYSQDWPLQVLFYCAIPAATGGETPIADCRRIYELLSEPTLLKFREKGIRYVRNLVSGIGLSWQDVYHTQDKSEVEKVCREKGISFEWVDDGHLRISWERPAILSHPATGEAVWFNHSYFFNARNIDPSVLSFIKDERHYPFNSYYGDGEPIEKKTFEELKLAYEKAKVSFLWQEGDILLLDNMRMAHGRNAYTGDRKVLVSLNDPYSELALEKTN